MSEISRLTESLAGRYAVDREIGAGGMATVYLARDLKHDRKVALKVLKPELGAVLGVERFLSEIKVTANLQHPNLLPLFDSGEANGLLFYVMPLVEGESLRVRLEREKQLPVEEAVKIAVAVANALAYAHEHGVIHRDLKPENILMQAGQPMIADFGIALAVSNAGGARVTQTGLSLGTPHYMSPEQAAGDRVIDGRSDIYSLGAVLYEMLAGEPPHSGTSAQAIIAKLMSATPQPLSALRKSAPVHVEAVLEVALAKLPADRFSSANDFAAALTNPGFRHSTAAGVAAAAAGQWKQRLAVPLAALAALLLVTFLWGWMRPEPVKRVVRYTLTLDSGVALTGLYTRVALSPDGSRLVYIGGPQQQLFVRSRDQIHATAVPGTEQATNLFFSPDGEQVGFFTGNSLRIVSLKGGPPTVLTDSLLGTTGASWGPGDFIVGRALSAPYGLMRIPARPGAVPKRFTVVDTAVGERGHSFPATLPNGKGVLFTVRYLGTKGPSDAAIAVADLATGKHTVLVNGVRALYAASGHLLYVTRNGTLMVVPFDERALKITGAATAVSEGLRLSTNGAADVAVSNTGTLIYAMGGTGTQRELVWVGRDGKVQPVDSAWPGEFESPSLSPDGTRLAIAIGDVGAANLWIKQLDRGPSLKLTLEGVNNRYPAWTPDGRSVTFYSNGSKRAGVFDLWTKRADGSGQAVLQLHQQRSVAEALWSPDMKWLIYRTSVTEAGAGDILAIRPGTDSVPVPLAATTFAERSPTLSPDGRWMAYASNETGRDEIFVVPFPNAGTAKSPVSTLGGTEPTWSHRNGELFYRDGAGNLVAAEVKTTPTLSLGHSTTLFPAAGFAADANHRQYAVAPDDRRFLMIRALGAVEPDKLVVVDNWFEELKAKAKK